MNNFKIKLLFVLITGVSAAYDLEGTQRENERQWPDAERVMSPEMREGFEVTQALDSERARQLLQDTVLAEERAGANPNLLDYVHGIIESHKSIKQDLEGSSAGRDMLLANALKTVQEIKDALIKFGLFGRAVEYFPRNYLLKYGDNFLSELSKITKLPPFPGTAEPIPYYVFLNQFPGFKNLGMSSSEFMSSVKLTERIKSNMKRFEGRDIRAIDLSGLHLTDLDEILRSKIFNDIARQIWDYKPIDLLDLRDNDLTEIPITGIKQLANFRIVDLRDNPFLRHSTIGQLKTILGREQTRLILDEHQAKVDEPD